MKLAVSKYKMHRNTKISRVGGTKKTSQKHEFRSMKYEPFLVFNV